MSDLPFTAVFQKQLGDTILLEPALHKAATATGQPAQIICPPAFADIISLFRNASIESPRTAKPAQHLIAYDSGSKATKTSFQTKAQHKQLLLFDDRYKKWYHRWVYNQTNTQALNDSYRAAYYWQHTPYETDEQFQPPSLKPPPDEWGAQLALPQRYLLIHPTSAWKRKCWMPESWAQTINSYYNTYKTEIILTSGPEAWEQSHVQDITSKLKCPHRNLAGKTTLREFIYTINHATAVACIDCSAFHLASALQRPVLGLFGPASSEHWSSEAAHVHTLSSRIHAKQPSKEMNALQLDTVTNKLLSIHNTQ